MKPAVRLISVPGAWRKKVETPTGWKDIASELAFRVVHPRQVSEARDVCSGYEQFPHFSSNPESKMQIGNLKALSFIKHSNGLNSTLHNPRGIIFALVSVFCDEFICLLTTKNFPSRLVIV